MAQRIKSIMENSIQNSYSKFVILFHPFVAYLHWSETANIGQWIYWFHLWSLRSSSVYSLRRTVMEPCIFKPVD